MNMLRTLLLLSMSCGALASAGCTSRKDPPDPPVDDRILEVDLDATTPSQLLVKVKTAGTVDGKRPVEIGRCEQISPDRVRVEIRLWDQTTRFLESKTVRDWAPADRTVTIDVLTDKSAATLGKSFEGTILDGKFWRLVASERATLGVKEQP